MRSDRPSRASLVAGGNASSLQRIERADSLRKGAGVGGLDAQGVQLAARNGRVPKRARKKDDKPTALLHSWVKVDAQGESSVVQVDKATLSETLGVHPRDLRLLDAAKSTAAILCRDKSIIVNMSFIRVIITVDSVLVLTPEEERSIMFMTTLKQRIKAPFTQNKSVASLATRLGGNQRGGNSAEGGQGDGDSSLALPFELRILEICLDELASDLDERSTALDAAAYPAVDALAAHVTPQNLERVRRMKNQQVALYKMAETYREVLEALLDDDKDMFEISLTAKEAKRVAEEEARAAYEAAVVQMEAAHAQAEAAAAAAAAAVQLAAAAAAGDGSGGGAAAADADAAGGAGQAAQGAPAAQPPAATAASGGIPAAAGASDGGAAEEGRAAAPTTAVAGGAGAGAVDAETLWRQQQLELQQTLQQVLLEAELERREEAMAEAEAAVAAAAAEAALHHGEMAAAAQAMHGIGSVQAVAAAAAAAAAAEAAAVAASEAAGLPLGSGMLAGGSPPGSRAASVVGSLAGGSPPSGYNLAGAFPRMSRPPSLMLLQSLEYGQQPALPLPPSGAFPGTPLPPPAPMLEPQPRLSNAFVPAAGLPFGADGASGAEAPDAAAGASAAAAVSVPASPFALASMALASPSFNTLGRRSRRHHLGYYHGGGLGRGSMPLSSFTRRSLARTSLGPSLTSSSRSGSSDSSFFMNEEISKVEMLLSAYFMHLDNVYNRLANLNEYIEDTEDMVNIKLDAQRNKLLSTDLVFSSVNAVNLLLTGLTGIFTMNLKSGLADKKGVFNEVTIVSSLGVYLLLGGAIMFFVYHGIMRFD